MIETYCKLCNNSSGGDEICGKCLAGRSADPINPAHYKGDYGRCQFPAIPR